MTQSRENRQKGEFDTNQLMSLPFPFLWVSGNGLVERRQLLLMGDDQLGVHLDAGNSERGSFHFAFPTPWWQEQRIA